MGREDPKADNPIPAVLHEPQIRLIGEVNSAMVERFLDQLASAPTDAEAIVVELTTFGGDAEIGRRLALEVRLARKRLKPRLLFLGKTEVYSAGVTMMAAFPNTDRYLTDDCVLLVHCRQLTQTIELSGPLRSSEPLLKALHAQIELGVQLEKQGFEELIEGSEVSMGELCERAISNWYLTAREALDRKLIAGLL